jgi:hypothetical protein
VTLDAALNLLWAAIGVVALGALGFSERHNGPGGEIGRLRRILAVLLVTVSLFPCVSATDDAFCFSLLQTSQGKHGGVGAPLPEDGRDQTSQTQTLARVLSSLDHSQVSPTYSFAILFSFIGLVLFSAKPTWARYLLCRAGRSPPCISCA